MDLELVTLDGAHQGAILKLPTLPALLGSHPSCAVFLDDPSVKERHAEILAGPEGQLRIRRLSEGASLTVNGNQVEEVLLKAGELVRVGGVRLEVRASSRPGQPDCAATIVQRPVRHEAATVEAGVFLTGGSDLVIAGRYRVLSTLGSGGMGEVYQAMHTELGRPFAVKVMRQELSSDRTFVERFKREATAAGKIAQKNICSVIDFGHTEEGLLYYVMEYLQGETLAQSVRREGPMPPARAARVASQICDALSAAHQLGIVHRDLKPENVMLVRREGEAPDFVKVLDFGTAKITDPQGGSGTSTVGGLVVGTPQYMSPEQASGLKVDLRADIYSLGLILYELLCGRPAFQALTPSMLMAAQISQAPVPLKQAGPTVTAELDRLVMRMLAKAPAERPQSMAEVREGLAKAVPATAPRPKSPSGPEPALPRVATLYPETERIAAPRKGALEKVGWAALAGALAFGGAALAVAVFKPTSAGPGAALSPAQPVAPPAPAAPRTVKLRLGSSPNQAAVYEADAMIGTTPLELEWAQSRRATLRFELAGHQPEVRTIAPEADLEVQVQLKATAPGRAGKPAARPPRHSELKDVPF